MGWFTSKNNEKNWDFYLSDLKNNSYYNLYNYKEFAKINGWNSIQVFYSYNNKVTSIASLLVKKKFFLKVIHIPGGIQGENNNNILKDLYKFIKQNFGVMTVIMIDMQESLDENYNYKNWYRVSSRKYETIIKSLSSNKIELIDTFSKNFRRNCIRSERYNDTLKQIEIPDIEELFELYNEMEQYKRIDKQYSKEQLSYKIECLKNNIINFELRDSNKKLISFRSFIFFQNYAWDYLAVTGKEGRKKYSSYKILNHIFKFCIDNKITEYDLSGIDVKNNLGVYNFKKGTGGIVYKRIGILINSPILMLKLLFFLIIFFKYKN
tara:strand:- start:113 stop:1078 length:966 start_codon:yes stop_codon:yes gene_type:complete